jgi:hypothetical protein
MATSAWTSQDFERDADGARKAAMRGPVFITDHGRATHVLLTVEDYLRLTGGMSVGEALAQPGTDFDFDPPRIGNRSPPAPR